MVCVVEIAGKGGISHYTFNLCRELNALKKKNLPLCLITGKAYELEPFEEIKTYKIFNKFKTNPLDLIKFFQVCSNKNVIHFQVSQYPVFILFFVLILKYLFKKKIVITAHNIISHEKTFYTKYVFNLLYKAGDKIIVHAKANKEELLNFFSSIPSDKVMVIPHGNYAFFNTDVINANKGKLKEEPYQYILFFGYIRRYKGLDDLLEAFVIIEKELPNARLSIVGKPIDDFNPYLKKINGYGLRDKVLMDLDYIPYKKFGEYFDKADVVVLPYKKVYQSGVLQLAYGFGKPVVVTNTGGLPEAVEEGRNGYIVPVGESKAMALSIIKILKDHNLRKKMGERSLRIGRTKFNWTYAAKKTKKVYENLSNVSNTREVTSSNYLSVCQEDF